MAYSEAQVQKFREITNRLVEEMQPDTPEAKKLRASFGRSPVKILRERGLPDEVIGHVLKRAGFPAADTPDFDDRAHRTSAHRIAGQITARGREDCQEVLSFDVVTTILTAFHEPGHIRVGDIRMRRNG